MNARHFRKHLATLIALVIPLLLFLPTPAAAGDVPFSPAQTIANLGGAASVYAADVDGDGDLDVLGAAQYDNIIAWWENTAGDGSAWAPHDVGGSFDEPFSVHAADVDGDGDVDVLSADFGTNTIVWWENMAGDGLVWTPHNVGTNVDAMSVYACDVDGDGDLDVLGTSFDSATVAWWENTAGNGSAWTQHILDSGFGGPKGVYGADVDGDGDLDVLGAAWGGNTIAWWENTAGDGTAWTPHTVSSTFNGAKSVYAADVDGDGDMDVLGAAEYGSVSEGYVAWWENTAGDGTAWTEHIVSSAFYGANSVYAADVDGDGDLDVLGAAEHVDTIAWWENTADDGTAWTEQIMSSTFDGAYSVYAADVDGDGNLDVLGAAWNASTIAWWQNEAIHRSAAYPPAGMHTLDSALNAALSVYAADLDGDGDMDVLGQEYNPPGPISWWENTVGDGSAWSKQTVDPSFVNASSVNAADIDGDGDLDVIAGSAYLAWWENTAGDGSAWTKHSVATGLGGKLSVADVDGDGDLDLVGHYSFGDTVAWMENTAGNGTIWTQHIVSNTFDGVECVYAADVDGDGDVDLLGASWNTSTIAWWENIVGDGTAWTEHPVASGFTSASYVYAADMDSDGDMDVLGVATNGSTIAWWENTAGDGSAWTQRIVSSAIAGPRWAYAADVDGDGDLDVLGAASSADAIVWWENTAGDGTAWTQHMVSSTFDSAMSVYAADADGDGDLDVLGAAWTQIAWWENRGGQLALVTTDTTPAEIVSGQADDVLKVTMTHLGRAGDTDEEWATAALLFETEFGTPMDSGQANTLIDSLDVYGDDGSGAFEPGADTLVTAVDTLALVNGVQTVTFADGDPNVQVAYGAPRTYFVVVELTPFAWFQLFNEFRVTHLTDPATGPVSGAEDRDHDLGLALEYAANTASGLISPSALADLAISKTASDDLVVPGQTLTYTLVYTNYGPSTADFYALGPTGTIVITDLVPAILTNVAYTASDPVLTPWPGITYTWSLWQLQPGEGGIITITGVVNPALPDAQPISNTAAIDAFPPDPDLANNSASTSGAVEIPIAGLALATNSPTPFGQPTFFTATVEAGSNVAFTWDWGDGGRSSERGHAVRRSLEQTVVVSHTYSIAGTYTAVVTATNSVGAESLGTTVEITAPPACLVPLAGASLTGLPEAYIDLTWFFTATLEPAEATAPITYTWSPEPVSGQGTGIAAYSWATTGTITLTVLAQNCGGEATASFAVQVLTEITTTVDPGVTTTIVYTDPQVVTTTVIIPPDAISESITLVFSPNPSPTHPISEGLTFANHSFDLDAYLGHQLLPGFAFSEPISVSVRYTDEDIADIQEPGLLLYYWTDSAWADGAGTCSPPSTYSRDLELNRIAVAICHLTEWNIQGPDSMRIIYLPLIVKDWTLAPDLVVERIVATIGSANRDDVQVVIKNQGNAPAVSEFWVDVYVDPNPPPTHVNQTWDQLGDQGLVWGVSAGALPLEPGEAITLTIGDAYYWAEYSYVEWPLPPGTPIYAQVDSADADTTYGAILELDEIRGLPYNNILGPVYSVPGPGRAGPAVDSPARGLHLPPR